MFRTLLAAASLFGVPAASGAGEITVFKSPDCGCCGAWADAMAEEGFDIRIVNRDWNQLDALKSQLGIAQEHAGCHTAQIDGYVVEGHVPAADIRRLLEQRPDAIGIAVPGMPVGSPGMETGDRHDAFDVVLVTEPGRAEVFSRYD